MSRPVRFAGSLLLTATLAACAANPPGQHALAPLIDKTAAAKPIATPVSWPAATVAPPPLLIPAVFTPAPAPAATALAKPASLPRTAPVAGRHHELDGLASYYWQDQMTASGERFNKHAMTAAHKTLPLGTRVRVTHLASGRAVTVRINDRGPFKPGRIIDLSEAAAKELQMTAAGLAKVRVEVVEIIERQKF